MIKTTLSLYFPNRLGRTVLLALEEVMGKSGLNALLNLSSLSHMIGNYPPNDENKGISFETISQLQVSLEQGYGPRGGRGLASRAGRVFFSHGLRLYNLELGLNGTAFRLQSPERKLMTVLISVTDFFNQYSDQQVTLEENEQSFLWRIQRCPWCWGRIESEPVCHFAVGMLQEMLYWVSGGKYYNVEEQTCIAQGDPTCIVCIDRLPLN